MITDTSQSKKAIYVLIFLRFCVQHHCFSIYYSTHNHVFHLSASIFLCKVTAWAIMSSTALLTGAGFNNSFPRIDGAARA